jgi:hypothetical protein
MGERLHGMQDVVRSTRVGSITYLIAIKKLIWC